MENVMNRTFLMLGLSTVAACAPTVTDADETSLERWLTTSDYAPTALRTDLYGASEFAVEMPDGKLVINIAAFDGTTLKAPFTFHPGAMDEFYGRGEARTLVPVDAEGVGTWLVSPRTPVLCGMRKLATRGVVTIADGSEHEVGIGIGWQANAIRYAASAFVSCPNEALGRGCTGACSYQVELPEGTVAIQGDCQETDDTGSSFRICECVPNEAVDEEPAEDSTQPDSPDGPL
jgi:hypothetical protein